MLVILEKWFSLQGERGHSSYLGVFKNKIERTLSMRVGNVIPPTQLI